MATRTANVKVNSLTIPGSAWIGLGVVAVGLVIMWAMPEARLLVGTVLVVGAALTAVLVVLRRRLTPEEHEEAAPLHLRD